MFRRLAAIMVVFSVVASAADLRYSRKVKDASGDHAAITVFVQGQRVRIDHRNEVGYGWKDGRPETITYGPRVATIFQCDMHRVLQLDFDHHQYTATEIDGNGIPVNGSVTDPPELRHSGVRVKVVVETRDTGETRQMFGHTARRFVTTRRMMPTAGACAQPHEITEDGWYIDVDQPQESCVPKRQEGIEATQVPGDQTACVDDYDVERTGPGLPPFAMDVTRTVRAANGAAHPISSEQIITDFERIPLDPQIFELPTGYKHVDRLDESPSLPWLLRGKLMWQSVKSTVWGWTPWGK